MRTLYIGFIGAAIAAIGTWTLKLTVHIGTAVVGGWLGYVVVAIMGAVVAIFLSRALRAS